VVTGIVLPYPRGQELVTEPGMDSFVMVKQFEIKLPEAEDKCEDEDDGQGAGGAGACQDILPRIRRMTRVCMEQTRTGTVSAIAAAACCIRFLQKFPRLFME